MTCLPVQELCMSRSADKLVSSIIRSQFTISIWKIQECISLYITNRDVTKLMLFIFNFYVYYPIIFLLSPSPGPRVAQGCFV